MSEDFVPPGGGELERLLRDAVADPALAERLRRDPLAAAKDHGVALSPTERAMLTSMDSAHLESLLSAMATTGIQPPHLLTADEVTFGIRDSSGPPVCTGIRSDPPPKRDLVSVGVRPDAHAPVRGIRPGRVAVAVAATATVIGVGVSLVTTAGSRPHRPATTAPRSLPDAGAPDADADGGADGGAERAPNPPDTELPKPTPK